MKLKILDCTLRDGGYYTDWDFNDSVVNKYIDSLNQLPIDIIEIGYRSIDLPNYLGKYFYLPIEVIENIKQRSNKKLAIILNEKDISVNHLKNLLEPCVNKIDIIRIAVDPKNIKRSILLAREIKKMKFQVSFNVMYMSTWDNQKELMNSLVEINDVADYFYMVDSFGSVYPEDVERIYKLIKKQLTIKIGFHGHNNLELALINTLTAIDCGVDIIDATITGMGRGAGNLKTELLLTSLFSKNLIDLDYNPLSEIVDIFIDLQKKYEWGTNLPYMVSGANSLPQKQVMEWVSKRFYSFNSIIRALENKSKGVIDNKKLQLFDVEKKYKKILLVGGGQSVKDSSTSLKLFLLNNPETLIIHSSSRNAPYFSDIQNEQLFCLVGNEGHRMEEVFNNEIPINSKCILPPFPRKMGTYIPSKMAQICYELKEITLNSVVEISHSLVALQTIININPEKVFVVGYDGYANSISKKEQELFIENELLFKEISDKNISMISLTKTTYSNLIQESLYSKI